MKEEDLISLGFERTDVSKEESGDEAFYYYTYDFGLKYGISLISCDDAEAKENGWFVEIFEDDKVSWHDYQDVLDFITIIRKGINK